MRRMLTCLFILSLVLSVGSAFAATMEMIPNPGFETGADVAAPPWYNQAAWGACVGQAVVGTTENPAHSGSRMWQMSGADLGAVNTVETQPVFAAGGGYFKCKAYVRVPTASASNPVTAQLRIWFGNTANLYVDGYWGTAVTLTSPEWTLIDDATTTGLFASAACTQVLFRVRVTSTDPAMVVYVDDASALTDRHAVTGRVVDNLGAPVAGANVFIGTTNPPDTTGGGVVTAADGTYSTAAPDGLDLYAMARVPGGKYTDSSVETLVATNTTAFVPDLVVAKIATIKLTGHVVDAATSAPIEGASVAVNDASGYGFGALSVTTTTNALGAYELEVLDPDANPIGTYEYYVLAKKLGYQASSEVYVDLTGLSGTVNLANLQLAVDPNYDPSLLLNAVVESIGGTNWATLVPADGVLLPMGSPTTEAVNGVTWEQNLYADGDGYNFGAFTDPIPCNGATIVAVVRPVRNAISTGWSSVVDCFYDNLVLAVRNSDGEVIVRRNGVQKNTGAFIDDGQKTVLSLVVQPDGTYVVYSNGMQIATETTTSPYTAIAPGTVAHAKNINIGRNNPDGWTTFNGNIGDVFIYKKALDNTKRTALVSSLGAKFGINTATYTITATAGANGSIAPAGAVSVQAEVNKTFTITPSAGFKIADVLVDGVSKVADVVLSGGVGTYTFTNVLANHTISATFSALPSFIITATAGTGGTIAPAGNVSVFEGSSQTFTIAPAMGFKILGVLVDGASVGAVSTYTFDNVIATHTISASYEALPPQIVSGTISNVSAVGIAGAKAYFKLTPTSIPSFTAIADSAGNYSQAVPPGTWYIAAGAAGYFNSAADLTVVVDAATVTGQNFTLNVNPNYYAVPNESDLLFFVNTDSLPASGPIANWAANAPVGGVFGIIGAPTVDNVGTTPVKWEKNIANNMGFYSTWLPNAPQQIIPVNGISAMAAVKPLSGHSNDRNWTPIIDILFGAFRLGVRNDTRTVILTVSTAAGAQTQYNSTFTIPDGQSTILSAVVQPTGSYEVWANGVSIMTGAGVGVSTQLKPNGTETRRTVCVGVSQDDGSGCVNGNIGDVLMWKVALATASRQALETALMGKFHAGVAYPANTITSSTTGGGGTISPAGATVVQYEADKTFVIVKNYGYAADVVVDGASQGDIASYTFNDVTAAHTIVVNYTLLPTRTISGHVTANSAGGATVSVKMTAFAVPGQQVTTDASGNYTMAVPEGAYYICASQAGYMISADTICNATGDQVIDFTLAASTRKIPQMETLLFAADSNSMGDAGTAGAWNLLYQNCPWTPATTALTAITTPTVTKVRGIKYDLNQRGTGGDDGYRLNASIYASPIPTSGATVVAVVKPVRNTTGDGWNSVVDIFRDNLILGVKNNTGQIQVRRNGTDYWSTNDANGTLATGQLAILSLVVQPDGQFKVWCSKWNSTTNQFGAASTILTSTATSAFTAFVPAQVNIADWARFINIGRNNGDGWTSFNGYIGDIFVYKSAMSDANRAALEADINVKTTDIVTYNITATAGANGSVTPAGVTSVGITDNQVYTITPGFGYNISDVLVDGVSNAGAISSGTYTFTNVNAAHTISATFATKTTYAVTGKVTNGTNPIPGATVYVSNAANASVAPLYTTTTDAAGNYSFNIFGGTWFAAASATDYQTSSDITVVVAGAPVVNLDIVLAASEITIPKMDQLLLSAISTDLVVNGTTTNPWAMIHPKGVNLALLGTPAVETVDGVKWEKNTYATYTGYNRGQFSTPIATTGVTAMAVVKPNGDGVNGGNWTSIIDVMYNRLILGIRGTDGTLRVCRNGVFADGPIIPNGQKTVLSLVVQPTGEYKVFANGIQVMDVTTPENMTTLDPTWNAGGLGFWSYISVGRNAPDGWTTYQGNIGGAFLWKTSLSSAERVGLEQDLGAKFGIVMPTYRNITVNAGVGGTITPAGNQMVIDGTSLSFAINPTIGYKIADVTLDGVSQGAVSTLDIANITANHAVVATFSVVPQWTVSGKVTDKKTGAAIAGASVYFSVAPNAKAASVYTATTDASGNYSQVVYEGAYYACSDVAGYYTTADANVTINANTTGVDFALTSSVRNIPRTADLLFSAVTDTLPWSGPTGPWATYMPEGGVLTTLGTPTVEVIDGVKWEKNTYTDGDGFLAGTYTDPIPVNGVTAVATIKPIQSTDTGNWRSIIDVFYHRLILGIHNSTGELYVRRNGVGVNTGAIIPDGQKTVLTLVVQPTGEYKVFANGEEKYSDITTSDMTALVPGPEGHAHSINVGRNQPDGWTTFNGNIGDVFLYKVALNEAERAQIEQDLSSKFDIHVPVFTTVSGKVTLDDGVTPIEGAEINCIGNIMTNAISNADGDYTLNVEVGSFVSISATIDSYLMVYPYDGQYDFVVGSEPTTGKNFRFTPVNTITGIVKDINNKPINNAVVQIGGIGGPGALTGPDGKYMITNITIGSVDLYADALGYADNTQMIDTTPAASGPFNYDITLTAKTEIGVIKNGGFEEVTAGVPNDWTMLWINTTDPAWPIVYSNPVPGKTDIFSATTDCVTGTYAGKYSTDSEWTFITQEIRVIPGSTYNFYMKLKGDAGVPNIFPMFAFRNDANEELSGYVSAEALPYNGWAFAPPTTWKSFLHWNMYSSGLAHVPSLRLTPPAGATKVTIWIGVTDAPGGKAIYADDVVIDRVGPDTMPNVDVASVRDLKAQPVGTPVKLLGTKTVTLAPTAEGVFYIGEESRIAGLRVVKSGVSLNAGDSVTDLTGTVKKTAGGEVYLELDMVPVGTAGAKMAPIAMNNKAASEDAKALSNLVKVWGKVTVSGSNFTITDGYSAPITVLTNGATLPAGFDGSTAAISGVVSKDDTGKTVILLGGL